MFSGSTSSMTVLVDTQGQVSRLGGASVNCVIDVGTSGDVKRTPSRYFMMISRDPARRDAWAIEFTDPLPGVRHARTTSRGYIELGAPTTTDGRRACPRVYVPFELWTGVLLLEPASTSVVPNERLREDGGCPGWMPVDASSLACLLKASIGGVVGTTLSLSPKCEWPRPWKAVVYGTPRAAPCGYVSVSGSGWTSPARHRAYSA